MHVHSHVHVHIHKASYSFICCRIQRSRDTDCQYKRYNLFNYLLNSINGYINLTLHVIKYYFSNIIFMKCILSI